MEIRTPLGNKMSKYVRYSLVIINIDLLNNVNEKKIFRECNYNFLFTSSNTVEALMSAQI